MKNRYMNPYFAGTLLGMVLLLAMYLSGRGLGASGGIRNCAISVVKAIDSTHAERSEYYRGCIGVGEKPLKNWITFEVMGILVSFTEHNLQGDVQAERPCQEWQCYQLQDL
jgi:hypothetical protein